MKFWKISDNFFCNPVTKILLIRIIAHIDKRNDNYGFFKENDPNERLKLHVDGDEWDQAFVEQILEAGSQVISDVEIATTKPFFKFPDFTGFENLPPYFSFYYASWLLILDSMNKEKHGEIEAAIRSFLISQQQISSGQY